MENNTPKQWQKHPDEDFLKGKPPEEIAWRKSVPENLRNQECMAYVRDVPHLPRVLLIGDSISMGYTVPVRKLLEGKANVHRIPANGGETARGLANMEKWLGGGNWDVIHFNFGIHDLKHIKDGKWDSAGKPVSSPRLYENNLRKLVDRLKATGATLICASTTPIPEGAPGVAAGGEIELNTIAEKIMAENDIPINDLHGYLIKKRDEYQTSSDVHYSPQGSQYLGEKVAKSITDIYAQLIT